MKPKKKDEADLSGIFGESISFRKVNGRVVAKIRRKRNMDNPTENQIAYKEKFLVGSAWASKHIENEDNKAFYTARITKKRQSAYGLALRDYCQPPRIDLITWESDDEDGKVGDIIKIKAFDRFMVTKVTVVIKDATGKKIEEGEAAEYARNPEFWHYRLTVANPTRKGTKIVATAYDRPEHTGTLEVVL